MAKGHFKDRGETRAKPPRNTRTQSPRATQTGRRDGRRPLVLPGGQAMIYGLHAVEAALANPRRKHVSLLMTDNAAIKLGLGQGKLPAFARMAAPREIDDMLGEDTVHQGAALITSALPAMPLEDAATARLIVVLDQVTDPHNLGAITRSAAALGADAIIMTERNSPPLDGVAAKTASGGMEHVPFALVTNLAQSITALREMGFLTVGLDSEGEDDLASLPLSAPLALVLGAEGKGLRRLTRERCDTLARVDMPGPIKSLNVSNAALLSLYIAHTRLGG